MIINCFEREEVKFVKEGSVDNEPTKEDCLAAVYAILQPGEPMTVEQAEKDLMSRLKKTSTLSSSLSAAMTSDVLDATSSTRSSITQMM